MALRHVLSDRRLEVRELLALEVHAAKSVDRHRDALIASKEYMRLAPAKDLDGHACCGADRIPAEITSKD